MMVSPEYNHSMSPASSDLLNHFPGSAFAFKPSLIATYSSGQWGGTRAAVNMRTFPVATWMPAGFGDAPLPECRPGVRGRWPAVRRPGPGRTDPVRRPRNRAVALVGGCGRPAARAPGFHRAVFRFHEDAGRAGFARCMTGQPAD
ncbi:NADPH-dependent FMN reductase [Lysobacter sp. A3-1-A15]|uniref:NADPH-dependent FMN reductase n=1 Tax=Novilysobacter viscosus TaxID=3098602 RepID=UPI003983C76A